MKQRALTVFLIVEAGACLLLFGLRAALGGIVSAVMAFPFEQIGLGLRWLSLSGPVGNGAAIALYAAVSLIPLGVLAALWKGKRLHIEDGILAVLSALLFFLLYLMVNPGLLVSRLGLAAGLGGKAMLGGVFYSVLACYLVLRILRMVRAAHTERLQRYLELLLGLLGALFVYLAFGACFGELLDGIQSLRESNQGNEHLLGASCAFLALRYLVDALPYVLDVLVVFAARALLRELQADRYSGAAVDWADRLSRLCVWSLAAAVLSNMALNLLQLFFAPRLYVISTTVQLPVLSIAFVLAVLLLARFIRENKRLKDDNDLFI